MVAKRTAVLWVRNDFRLSDNLALMEAASYDEVLPIFVWDPEDKNPWQPGAASKWWLHHTIIRFRESLRRLGSGLVLLRGSPEEQLLKAALTVDASHVLYNDSHNPTHVETEKNVQRQLLNKGIIPRSFHGSLLCTTKSLLKQDGSPYLVYTPFWRNFLKSYEPSHLAAPTSFPPLPKKAASFDDQLEAFGLLPTQHWHEAFHQCWTVGEEAATEKLHKFVTDDIESYDRLRDFPSEDGTSTLSPHLHFGELHPQRVLHAICQSFGELPTIRNPNIVQFCKEILWREFSYHLLHHFPKTAQQPLREAFKKFPWKRNRKLFDAWRKGQTGYPIVDAGMRQLWATGWMHNRVRMITASFLVKHLAIPWQDGAKWFWDTLVDADLASNTQGWQWTAGCGADAAPFFRIFNPITQGEKFDPKGRYATRWCPELANLPPKWIYRPWEAPASVLNNAGIVLGATYPLPMVDHRTARDQALWNYDLIKSPKSVAPT